MEIRLLGGEPEMLNGMAMPSALADVVTASTQMDEQAVLLECEHMEKAVSQVFEEALDDSNMPFELVITLRRQHGEVRVAIDRLHTLERPLTAGAS